jgi:hypothetical protein
MGQEGVSQFYRFQSPMQLTVRDVPTGVPTSVQIDVLL